MKKIYSPLIFVILLVTTTLLYQYHKTLFFQPQSVHKWRQSDCASLALNYYQGGMRFFEPETHNLTSNGGTTGKAFTSEVPFLYYGVALLYKIFGPHDYIFRVVNMLLFFLGLFYFYKLLQLLIKKTFWAVTIPLLFFTSPVLVYYGNNFLSNSAALAFSMIGWYYFMGYIFNKRFRWFVYSVIAFFFAGAFKLTAFMSLFAIGALWLIEVFILSEKKSEIIFQNKKWLSLGLLFSAVVLVLIWVVYAHRQNTFNQCNYFSTTIFPIWDLTPEGIVKVFQQVKNQWWPQYYHPLVHFFILGCYLILVFLFKKIPFWAKIILMVLMVEALFYILLQYWTFNDHDYYTIDLFIIPFLLMTLTFWLLNSYYEKWINSVWLKIVFSLFLLFNIWSTSGKIKERYFSSMNDYTKYEDIYTIKPYLRQIGITSNDTVISIPDNCHATLYLMNQKGWTQYVDQGFNRGTKKRYNGDSTGIENSIKNGARYLILNGLGELYEKPYLQYFCYHLKGRYKNVIIFDLQATDTNFVLTENKVLSRWFCDADTLSSDGKSFINDNQLFEYGNTQNRDEAYSGSYSCMLSQTKPYGMTVKIGSAKFGERFEVSVWRKTTDKNRGGMVISVEGNVMNENKIVVSDSSGWEKQSTQLFISPPLDGKELVIFVYNPDKTPVYFDDFEIIRYQSVMKND